MSNVIIVVEGGMIQNVMVSDPLTNVIIIDYDNFGDDIVTWSVTETLDGGIQSAIRGEELSSKEEIAKSRLEEINDRLV